MSKKKDDGIQKFEITQGDLMRLLVNQQVQIFEPQLFNEQLFRWYWNEERRFTIEASANREWRTFCIVL